MWSLKMMPLDFDPRDEVAQRNANRPRQCQTGHLPSSGGIPVQSVGETIGVSKQYVIALACTGCRAVLRTCSHLRS